jgi:diguanylate cyclase (GGDEF)-like protein
MVLLPQAALQAAWVVAERLRTTVADALFESGTQQLTTVTVSIGIAQFGLDGDTIESILHIADERLYDAKHQGRNRVVPDEGGSGGTAVLSVRPSMELPPEKA